MPPCPINKGYILKKYGVCFVVDHFPSDINSFPPSCDQELKDCDIAGGHHVSYLGDQTCTTIDQLSFDLSPCQLSHNQKMLTFYLLWSSDMLPHIQGGEIRATSQVKEDLWWILEVKYGCILVVPRYPVIQDCKITISRVTATCLSQWGRRNKRVGY